MSCSSFSRSCSLSRIFAIELALLSAVLGYQKLKRRHGQQVRLHSFRDASILGAVPRASPFRNELPRRRQILIERPAWNRTMLICIFRTDGGAAACQTTPRANSARQDLEGNERTLPAVVKDLARGDKTEELAVVGQEALLTARD